jgi:hypothetical protein
MATIGAKLIELRKRSGLTLDEVSSLAGYRGRSSVQQFFNEDYDPQPLETRVANRLAKALVGRGTPPIEEKDITALMGLPDWEPKMFTPYAGQKDGLLRSVPVYSSKTGDKRSFKVFESERQVDLETMLLVDEEAIGFAWFPPAKDPQTRAYGLYISTSMMYPRFGKHEMVLVEAKRPAKALDDVIVHIAGDASQDPESTCAIVGRLVSFEPEGIRLLVFTPGDILDISFSQIQRIERIMSVSEILWGG